MTETIYNHPYNVDDRILIEARVNQLISDGTIEIEYGGRLFRATPDEIRHHTPKTGLEHIRFIDTVYNEETGEWDRLEEK